MFLLVARPQMVHTRPRIPVDPACFTRIICDRRLPRSSGVDVVELYNDKVEAALAKKYHGVKLFYPPAIRVKHLQEIEYGKKGQIGYDGGVRMVFEYLCNEFELVFSLVDPKRALTQENLRKVVRTIHKKI